MFDPYKIPGSRSLHERRMATWALLVGETYSSECTPRRAGVRIEACCRTSTSRAPCLTTAGLRWCAASSG
ncbi:hypothetical protein [Mesorhizobium sp.]|uniref:hypothetical protein n=1 Tax=Mesorhizobium sp. TaxID=1871066 RepID=UPI0025C281B8|nr:hypothetical protein [Mesorhizobium sp.]